MAMIERDVVLVGKDADGNTTVDMPITRLGNLEDTAETKTAPVSGDALAIVDSEAQGEVKKISWADVVNAVKDAVGGDDGAALSALKQALDEHEADGAAHVTASEKAAWNAKAEEGHNHDGRYYTESEVNTLLAGKETSGAAATVQTKLNTHANDGVAHVTAQEREKWNSAGDGSAKVGDILYSSRRDLGEKWALCNGDLVDPEEYPELNALLPEGGKYGDEWTALSGENAPSSAKWLDGYLVGFAKDESDWQFLVYSKSPTGPWKATGLTRDVIGTNLNQYSLTLAKEGSCYVVYSDSSRYICYTTGSLASGSWTNVLLPTSNYILKYGNGYWISGLVKSGNFNLRWLKGSTPNGSWTQCTSNSSSYGAGQCIYHNGVWVATSGGLQGAYVSTDSGASWKWVSVSFPNSSVTVQSSFASEEGYLFYTGYYPSGSKNYGVVGRVSFGTLASGMSGGSATLSVVKDWYGTDYCSATYHYAYPNLMSLFTTDTTGKKTLYVYNYKNGDTSTPVYWRSADNGSTWTLSTEAQYEEELGNGLSNEGIALNTAYSQWCIIWRKLPAITVPGSYAYIKVKD